MTLESPPSGTSNSGSTGKPSNSPNTLSSALTFVIALLIAGFALAAVTSICLYARRRRRQASGRLVGVSKGAPELWELSVADTSSLGGVQDAKWPNVMPVSLITVEEEQSSPLQHKSGNGSASDSPVQRSQRTNLLQVAVLIAMPDARRGSTAYQTEKIVDPGNDPGNYCLGAIQLPPPTLIRN